MADPNRKSNQFKPIIVPQWKLRKERWKAFNKAKRNGSSDMVALVKALEIQTKKER